MNAIPWWQAAFLMLLCGSAAVSAGARARRLLRDEDGEYSEARRWIAGGLLALVAVVAVAIGACSTWNAWVEARVRQQMPAPDGVYVVNGLQMHLECMGGGEPTIILDAGLGNDSLIWGQIQPALAQTTQVCAYDRAGFGWSQSGPAPQDADQIAGQLHGLLQQAGVTGPVVLMAHSIAGIYARDYARLYPGQLKGLVLLDAATPLQSEHGSARLQARERAVPMGEMVWARLEYLSGWTRLTGGCLANQRGFDPKTAQMLAEDECHLPFESIVQELDSAHQSGEEAMQRTSFGRLPVLIFSRDTEAPAPAGMEAGLASEYRGWWNRMQANLLNLSTDSRRVVVKGSGHYVFLKRPELVVREVQRFIEHVRDNAIPGNDAAQPGPRSQTE